MSLNQHSARLAFLRIDETSRAALREFQPIVVRNIPQMLGRFYGHLKTEPKLAAMFASAATMERAKAAQAAHWRTAGAAIMTKDGNGSVCASGVLNRRKAIYAPPLR